jgi:trans-aconitate methyltransferase
MLARAGRRVRRLYYDLVLGPQGYGWPIPKAGWEAKHKQKYWDFLSSPGQATHYLAILDHISRLHQEPTILDVGCGNGRLLELLDPSRFESYVGIDVSSTAIQQAESLGIQTAWFEVADFEEWSTPRRFHTIVFNESLYYARRPAGTLWRYGGFLDEGGSMIVSMVRHGHHGAIWRSLEERFQVLQSTAVENGEGQAWDIKVLRPWG